MLQATEQLSEKERDDLRVRFDDLCERLLDEAIVRDARAWAFHFIRHGRA